MEGWKLMVAIKAIKVKNIPDVDDFMRDHSNIRNVYCASDDDIEQHMFKTQKSFKNSFENDLSRLSEAFVPLCVAYEDHKARKVPSEVRRLIEESVVRTEEACGSVKTKVRRLSNTGPGRLSSGSVW